MPDLYCWAVADPLLLTPRPHSYVDLAAFLPFGLVAQKYREQEHGVSGIRFGDIPMALSPQWLLESLTGAIDPNVHVDTIPSTDELRSVDELLKSDWFARNVLGLADHSGADLLERHVLDIAETSFQIALTRYEAASDLRTP